MTKTIEVSPVSGFSAILSDNKNEMTRIENFKSEKISATPRNIVFAGVALGGLALVGMIGASIISGVVAVVTTVVAGGGLYYGIRIMKRMDPVIKQKLKNKQIELMISEARKNAIFQLDNQVLTNHSRLAAAREARNKIGGQIKTLEGKINPANEGKPTHTKKTKTVATLKVAYEKIKANVDKGAQANKVFEEKVIEYKDMESFAQAAGEVMDLLNTSGNDKLEDMLSLESFNAIDSNFNEAMINIENGTNDYDLDQTELD